MSILVCYLLLISSVSSIRSVYLGVFYGTRGSIKLSHLTSKWYSVWAQRINALMNRWHAVRFRYGSCLSGASTRTDSSQSYISTVVGFPWNITTILTSSWLHSCLSDTSMLDGNAETFCFYCLSFIFQSQGVLDYPTPFMHDWMRSSP